MSYAVSKSRRRLPDRQPAAVRHRLPPRLRAGPQRPDRRAARRSASGCPAADPTTPRRGDRKKPEPVPEGFDYDRWLGPAPEAPYAPARCHVNFRWIYDYSGGQVTDWGGHHPDCAQWGMGTELTGPIEIRNAKGDVPARPALEHGHRVLVRGRLRERRDDDHLEQGEDGRDLRGHRGDGLRQPRQASTTDPKSILDSKIGPNEIHLYKSDDHFRNFIDCVISRGPTAAPVEVAHRSITICHLGNIAMRLGRETPAVGPAGPSGSSATTRPRRC